MKISPSSGMVPSGRAAFVERIVLLLLGMAIAAFGRHSYHRFLTGIRRLLKSGRFLIYAGFGRDCRHPVKPLTGMKALQGRRRVGVAVKSHCAPVRVGERPEAVQHHQHRAAFVSDDRERQRQGEEQARGDQEAASCRWRKSNSDE